MIVTAALAWFDEPLELLDECVRHLPVMADRLVAVDGAYSRYPGAKIASPRNQAAQIRETAKDVGLDVEIHTPTKLWAGQVEKRSFLIQQAGKGSDWFVPADADHIWHGVRYTIRHELENLDPVYDTVSADMFTPMNYEQPIEETAAGEWHVGIADKYVHQEWIFRSLPDLRVERRHWWYSARRGSGRVWLMGGPQGPTVKVHRLQAPFLVEHKCLHRQQKQVVRNRVFCEDRVAIVAETAQEDDPRMVAV